MKSTNAITQLKVRAVRLPMPVPHRTAGGVISESPLVLLDLYTSAGVVGRSYVFTYTPVALLPTAMLLRELAPSLVGVNAVPHDVERVLTQRFRLLGPQGLTGIAVAAVDMAIWDVVARTAQVSLVTLLGASSRPLRAYGGVGYDGVRGSADAAERWARAGMSGVKAKIGYPSVQEDLDVIRAMRSAVGNDIEIMVDYNQCLNAVEARTRLRALDDEGLCWIEEPTTAHDFAGLSACARETRTPLQAGENWWGPGDFVTAIDAGASDHLMPDVMKVGGVTGWMRVAALAQAKGLPVSNHLFPEVSVHLMTASPTAFRFEYADWWNAVIQEPLAVENGFVEANESRVGSGIEWNEELIATHIVE
ncbi:enolase C-terminal domain-like protein [Paraburkholderia nemoris]|uniref:enolase C-terminal domain-like protein n=1 Tax=Paraburkholderia nemoris TaxID=2793076 RepID=UPI0038B8CBE1